MKGRELLKKILRDLDGVPPMPSVVQRVMSITQNPDATAKELHDVISLDQALTANVLKLCNSAYYGLPRKIASVQQAVNYLGFRTIRNLVLSAFLGDVYGGTVALTGYSPNGLWEHSIAVAISAQLICERLKRPDADDISFTCGLLHDVGKPILWKHARESQDEVLDVVRNQGKSYAEAEREVLGFDHAALGAKVADVWNFPPELIQAIGLHHDPAKARGDRFLTQVTHMANQMAVTFGVGLEDAGMVASPLDAQSLAELGLEASMIDTLQEPLAEAYEKASPFVGLGKK